MRFLELRIPPPVVMLLVAAAMWVGAWWAGRDSIGGWIWVPAVLAACGVGIAFAAVSSFRRARTTTSPLHPEAASVLVTGGVFGQTRNPMYLAMALMLLAWSAYLGGWPYVLGPVAYVAYLTCFQIIPEERILFAKFADTYTAYRAKVRRWI
jgi:protein-S-isoprenylcysteine O-methyltransferase Ste14